MFSQDSLGEGVNSIVYFTKMLALYSIVDTCNKLNISIFISMLLGRGEGVGDALYAYENIGRSTSFVLYSRVEQYF